MYRKLVIIAGSLFFIGFIIWFSNTSNPKDQESKFEKIKKEELSVIVEKAKVDKDYQHALGKFYFHGIKVEENTEQAIYWYELAANNGVTDAYRTLATIYLYKDTKQLEILQKVEYWLKKSSDAGNASASYDLGVMYSGKYNYFDQYKKNERKVIHYHSLAIQQGTVLSKNYLAYVYIHGSEEFRNYKKAIELLSDPYYVNDADVQFELAHLYLKGLGTEQDFKKGLTIMFRAASLGNKQALKFIRILREDEKKDP